MKPVKPKPKKSSSPGTRRTSSGGPCEWVGGKILTPFYVTEDGPYRPEMILWLELPEGPIVFTSLLDPKQRPPTFGGTLLQAMKSPMAGPPRKPDRVRVADADLAAEVRMVLPGIPVEIAPTPELEEVIKAISRFSEGELDEVSEKIPNTQRGERMSYLENGRVPPDAVEDLFRSAGILYRLAPWKVMDDRHTVRVDIPEYGVHGACMSVIGTLGQSLGFLLFPSLRAFESFLEMAERKPSPRKPIDLGTTVLALDFEKGSELPGIMHKEALRNGWPVENPDAYPVVTHRDRDGVPRPLTEKDVRIMSHCAVSFSSFFLKHDRIFKETRSIEPVCESWAGNDGVEVRFTAPYEASNEFAINDAAVRRSEHPRHSFVPESDPSLSHTGPRVGRNDPCPCGSGKKYKRCCLTAKNRADAARASIHDLDNDLVDRMVRFADQGFGSAWLLEDEAGGDFVCLDPQDPFHIVWALYHQRFDGETIADLFLEQHGRILSTHELAWMEAQRAAWLSVWEVLDVEPGRSIKLKDLLTGEVRVVSEAGASRSLVKRDTILTRVVDHEGISVLAGTHTTPLPPLDADKVIAQMHRKLRRKSSIPIERLRAEKTGRYLIDLWDDTVDDVEERASQIPEMQNTDGDPLLLTTDHFAFDPADRGEIHRRLAAVEGVEAPKAIDTADGQYVLTKPGNPKHKKWENTVTGVMRFDRNTLKGETNSIARADALRSVLEGALGPLIKHRAREHSDPVALIGKARAAAGPKRGNSSADGPGRAGARKTGEAPLDIPQDEIDRILREQKSRTYADWSEHPLPALGGLTARDAVKTKEGRKRVDTLLREMENREARVPAGQRFDFNIIRRELGLGE
jgi:hypothetical protein